MVIELKFSEQMDRKKFEKYDDKKLQSSRGGVTTALFEWLPTVQQLMLKT